MSFVHLSLLTLGGLFTAVPIVMHLAMRQKPRHQVFPAIRFLSQRQMANQRRLRLRQAILLLLRCMIVLLLALALARPSVNSAQLSGWLVAGMLSLLLLVAGWLTAVAAINRRGVVFVGLCGLVALGLLAGLLNSALALIREKPPILLGDRKAAVAAAILIDTSPRMQYQYGNQNRLERAQEISRWLLRQFPTDSQIAVIDSSNVTAAFSVDLGAASASVEALEVAYVPQPLSRMIDDALDVLRESRRQRKELYILTDLTRMAWDDVTKGNVAESLREAPNVSLQVIDVGVERPTNTAITDLEPSRSILTPGSPVDLRVGVARSGREQSVPVELFMEAPDDALPVLVDGVLQAPEATMRARRTIELEENGESLFTFSLASLPHGTHHGYLQIQESDGLAIDDRRNVTVHVRAPWNVLVADASDGYAHFLTELLAPLEFREQGRSKFQCTVVPIGQLGEQRLTDYDAVGLLDPPPLNEAVWAQLRRYVERGGGVAIFLGRNARSAAEFNSQEAMSVLPGIIERRWRDPTGIILAPRDYDNPILSAMRDFRTTVPWDGMPIFQHWVLGELTEDSRTLIPFSNNKPALVERNLGQGRVVLMTTPISDPDLTRRRPWNLLPTSFDSWPFLILIDRLFLALVQSDEAPLNYSVGQPAQLRVDARTAERFSLLTPRGSWLELTSEQGRIRVPFTETPGTYRLNADPSTTHPRGFSVNLPAAASRLDRMSTDELNAALGEDRYRLARTASEITREIDHSRVGKEFYPFLLPLLVVVLALEYVTANRFYPDAG